MSHWIKRFSLRNITDVFYVQKISVKYVKCFYVPKTSDKVEKYFFVEKNVCKICLRAKFNIYVPRKRRKKYLKNISDSFHRQNNTWKIWKNFLPLKIIWNMLKMFLQATINICETWKMFCTCRKISKKDSRRFYRQKKYLWNMKDV